MPGAWDEVSKESRASRPVSTPAPSGPAGRGPSSEPATGIILAGGKSTRLGQDKALLRLDTGATLLEATIARVQPLVDDVVVVADDAERFGSLPALCVPDLFPGAGSLGGVYSGLSAAAHSRALVVACDMPFLKVELLRHMLAQPLDCDALVPRLRSGLLEPLHAVYARSCLDPIRQQLASRRFRIVAFFDLVRVRYMDEPELRQFDPDLRSFFNINTPEELFEATRLGPG